MNTLKLSPRLLGTLSIASLLFSISATAASFAADPLRVERSNKVSKKHVGLRSLVVREKTAELIRQANGDHRRAQILQAEGEIGTIEHLLSMDRVEDAKNHFVRVGKSLADLHLNVEGREIILQAQEKLYDYIQTHIEVLKRESNAKTATNKSATNEDRLRGQKQVIAMEKWRDELEVEMIKNGKFLAKDLDTYLPILRAFLHMDRKGSALAKNLLSESNENNESQGANLQLQKYRALKQLNEEVGIFDNRMEAELDRHDKNVLDRLNAIGRIYETPGKPNAFEKLPHDLSALAIRRNVLDLHASLSGEPTSQDNASLLGEIAAPKELSKLEQLKDLRFSVRQEMEESAIGFDKFQSRFGDVFIRQSHANTQIFQAGKRTLKRVFSVLDLPGLLLRGSTKTVDAVAQASPAFAAKLGHTLDNFTATAVGKDVAQTLINLQRRVDWQLKWGANVFTIEEALAKGEIDATQAANQVLLLRDSANAGEKTNFAYLEFLALHRNHTALWETVSKAILTDEQLGNKIELDLTNIKTKVSELQTKRRDPNTVWVNPAEDVSLVAKIGGWIGLWATYKIGVAGAAAASGVAAALIQ